MFWTNGPEDLKEKMTSPGWGDSLSPHSQSTRVGYTRTSLTSQTYTNQGPLQVQVGVTAIHGPPTSYSHQRFWGLLWLVQGDILMPSNYFQTPIPELDDLHDFCCIRSVIYAVVSLFFPLMGSLFLTWINFPAHTLRSVFKGTTVSQASNQR